MENKINKIFTSISHDLEKIMDSYLLKITWFVHLSSITEPVRIEVIERADEQLILGLELSVERIMWLRPHLTGEISRTFVNDLYFCISRYCYFLRKQIDDPLGVIDDPAHSREVIDQVLHLIYPFISKEDSAFLTFFHRLRNSLVHYDGLYNTRNRLDYKFAKIEFKTTDAKLGSPIFWTLESLLELYDMLYRIFDYKQFCQNKHFVQRVMKGY